jgi:hypothetical protein
MAEASKVERKYPDPCPAIQILDADEFILALRKDLESLSNYALIVSLFLNRSAVEKFCNLKETGEALRRGE